MGREAQAAGSRPPHPCPAEFRWRRREGGSEGGWVKGLRGNSGGMGQGCVDEPLLFMKNTVGCFLSFRGDECYRVRTKTWRGRIAEAAGAGLSGRFSEGI